MRRRGRDIARIGPQLFSRILVLCACAGVGGLAGTAWRARTGVREAKIAPIDARQFPAAGMSVGGAGVPTVRVFGDYECPACRELDRRYGDSLLALAAAGRIRLIYHHSPLRSHALGELAGTVAYCAASRGGGWRVHRALYARSLEWGSADAKRSPESALRRMLAIAAATGVDSAAVHACVASGGGAAAVREDRAMARRLGVHAVPAVFADSARLEFRSYRALLRHVTRLAS